MPDREATNALNLLPGIADMAGLATGATRTRMIRMYGPAARCKRFRQPGRCGLASMYPASDWSVLCSGPSWISTGSGWQGINGRFLTHSGRWMFGRIFGLDGRESYRELRLELLCCPHR